jgi:polyhydroxybutyrate depolymerase
MRFRFSTRFGGGLALFAVGILVALIGSTGCSKSGSSSSSSGSSGTDPGTSSGNPSSSGGGTSGGATSGGPPPAPKIVDVSDQSFTFNGQNRIYVFAKPKTYDASKAYPLVLSFHGNPGDAHSQAGGLPFESASGSDAIIAYPQALSADSGAFSWDLYTAVDDNADMNFIKALIDDIASKANIDKTKVLGYGYSGGGFFLAQYGCIFGGVFKALSINAGGGPDQLSYSKRDDGCYVCPAGPIPTIVTHGQTDSEVPVDSGIFTAACYADGNGCGTTRTATTPAPCELFDGCPATAPVKRCIIPNQGHGPWSESMNQAWAFFKALN